MLDLNRIKEAEENVRKYLDDGLLKKIMFNEQIFKTYLQNSDESLMVAQLIFKNQKSNLWVIVTSYYSMFYIANAVLYRLGYKVGDKIGHKITNDSLIVFVRNKLKKHLMEDFEEIKIEALELVQNKADNIILNYDQERQKRGKFQYQMSEDIKKAKALTSLNRAKEFVNELKNLVEGLK